MLTLKEKHNHEEENFFNPPNAAKTLEAFCCSAGYNFNNACMDIIDNSIEAIVKIPHSFQSKSKLKQIRIQYSDRILIIADNGCGMDKEKLKDALTFGSISNHNVKNDLGKFGMGLKVSAMSIGKKLTVITKEKDGDYIKGIFDKDVIVKENNWIVQLSFLEDNDYKLINSIFPNHSHGTFVIIENFVKKYDSPSSQRANTLTKIISSSFWQIINSGIEIKINDKKANSYDPLEWDLWSTSSVDIRNKLRHKSDGEISVAYIDKNGKPKKSKITYKAISFPFIREGDYDPHAADRKKNGIITKNSTCGIYIYRNNREVGNGETLSMFQKHTTHHSMRISISYNGEIDEQMGTNYSKRMTTSSCNIDQSIFDKIQEIVTKIASAVTKKCNDESKDKNVEKVNNIHEAVTASIESKANSIDCVNIKKPTREKGNAKGSKNSTGKGASHKSIGNGSVSKANLIWKESHMSPLGPLYSVGCDDKNLTITWNVDHKLYLIICSDKKCMYIMDLLIYSLAVSDINIRFGVAEGEEMVVADILDDVIVSLSKTLRSCLADVSFESASI